MICPACSSNQSVSVRGEPYCLNCGRKLELESGALVARGPGRPQPAARPGATINLRAESPKSVTTSKPVAVARALPIELEVAWRATAQTLRIRPLRRTSWLTTVALAAAGALAIELSRGLLGRLSYLRSTGAVIWLPPVVLILVLIWVKLIWLRASATYSYSHKLDERPVAWSRALQAGWNATGRLVGLALIGLVATAVWSLGLVAAIRLTDGLSVGPSVQTITGIVVCLVMALVGLMLIVLYSFTTQLIILGDLGLLRALGKGIIMTRRTLAASIVLVVWLITLGMVLMAIVVGIWLSPHWTSLSPPAAGWLAVGVGLLMLRYYLSLTQITWLVAYRRVIRAHGSHQLAVYLGRKPRPVHPAAISVSLVWWIVLATLGSWWLWHHHYDPTALLNRLHLARLK